MTSIGRAEMKSENRIRQRWGSRHKVKTQRLALFFTIIGMHPANVDDVESVRGMNDVT